MPSHSPVRYVLLKTPIALIRGLIPIAQKLTQPPPPPADEHLHYSTPRGQRAIDIYFPAHPATGPETKPDQFSPNGAHDATHGHVHQGTDPGDDLLPVHLNLHGSGFTIPSHKSDGLFCRRTADAVPCVVLDIDHSHAPEHPFPAALQDIEEVLRWVDANAEKRGWDRARVSIGGFSSGGNLALCASSMESLRGRFRAVAAVYPSTNLAQNPSDKPKVKPAKGATGGTIPPSVRKLFYACYLTPETDRNDPRITVLNADPEWFPSTVTIVTCGGDSLAAEANELVEKLRKAGKDIENFEAPGQGHAWDLAVKKEDSEPGKLRDRAYELIGERLSEALKRGGAGAEPNG